MYEELQGITGVVQSLHLSPTGSSSSFVMEERESLIIEGKGILGDRHSGFTRLSDARTRKLYQRETTIANTRQISLVSVVELQAMASSLVVPEIRAEWLGANVLIEGIPEFTQLPPTVKLHFYQAGKEPPDGRTDIDDVVLKVEGENLPCINPGNVLQEQYPKTPNLANQFKEMAKHRRGLVATVELVGKIARGDRVRIIVPDHLLERDK